MAQEEKYEIDCPDCGKHLNTEALVDVLTVKFQCLCGFSGNFFFKRELINFDNPDEAELAVKIAGLSLISTGWEDEED